MIYRLKRQASYYSIKELMNDTIRLSNHPPKNSLIWTPESKYHPEFGMLKQSNIVSDRFEFECNLNRNSHLRTQYPFLVLSFVLLGSIVFLIIVVFIKYVIAEREYSREMETQRSATTLCENSSFPTSSSTDPFVQTRFSKTNNKRKSIRGIFREFRL
jgi:hypothetical protein